MTREIQKQTWHHWAARKRGDAEIFRISQVQFRIAWLRERANKMRRATFWRGLHRWFAYRYLMRARRLQNENRDAQLSALHGGWRSL